MYVIATAGHVDHGKSTLLRALTGMEPDRWAQERERGMTIDLGYVWTTLPGGERVAFVDVPGHERFVGNMLAGVGPVPAVLFVVAADEGWMPQSAEHLAALDALGVEHGLLVATRSDRADPELALGEAREYLRGTSLAAIPEVAVSAVTGAGMADLPPALERMVAGLPAPDPCAPVRLWVDRAFVVRGSGTVVTGTLGAGTVRVGDVLHYGRGQQARVRSLQALHEEREEVSAVARVAVNVRVSGRGDIGRGTALVTPERWTSTRVVDCWVDLAQPDGEDGWRCPLSAALHIGSARVSARIRPLQPAQGTRIAARLTLATELPLHVGDRALLRDANQARGSRIVGRVTVVDVRPPELRRRGAAAARGAYLMSRVTVPDGQDLLAQRGIMRRSAFVSMGTRPPGKPFTADWYVDEEHLAGLRRAIVEAVAAHRAANPLEPGMTLDSARHVLHLPDRRLVEALVRPPLRVVDGRIVDGQTAPGLPPAVASAIACVCEDLSGQPFRAPEQERLDALGLDRRALAAAERAGCLLRVADDVVLLPGAGEAAVTVLRELPQPFTVGAARQALDSTRRVVVPLLEYLDRRGLTERLDETGRRRVATSS